MQANASKNIIGVGGPKRSPHGIGFSCMPGRGRGSVVGGVPGRFFSVRACVRPCARQALDQIGFSGQKKIEKENHVIWACNQLATSQFLVNQQQITSKLSGNY